MSSNVLECENVDQNVHQRTKFGKKSIVVAFVVGMLVGTLGLAAASSLGPAALSSRNFAAPARVQTGTKQGLRSAPIMSDALDTVPEALKLDLAGELDKAGTDFCSRRNALGRAAAAMAAMIGAPSLVSAGGAIKMGSDEGKLVFEPSDIAICKGDTVTWTNNKAGPHNVVFSDGDCPDGFDTEENSMDDVIGEAGGTFSFKFDIAGSYKYRCAPHAGAGMIGAITVK
jgi:plastocyanin